MASYPTRMASPISGLSPDVPTRPHHAQGMRGASSFEGGVHADVQVCVCVCVCVVCVCVCVCVCTDSSEI